VKKVTKATKRLKSEKIVITTITGKENNHTAFAVVCVID
jgi:hypothetical protein